MQLEVGKIYEGKVTGITKFGAFVELDKDTTGMVHISEVANTFVSEIKDHIQEGQTVKVKVMSLGDDGKISLSIKKALPAPPRKPRPEGSGSFHGGNNTGNGYHGNNNGGFHGNKNAQGGQNNGQRGGFNGGNRNNGGSAGGFRGPRKPFDRNQEPQDFTKNPPPVFDSRANSGNSDFEDMLTKFKATSEERFTDLKKVIDNKRKSPSRRK